jgi:hypothetical protein
LFEYYDENSVGCQLQDYKRLTLLLKRYESISSKKKKAEVFTVEQIYEFLKKDVNVGKILLVKLVAIVGYYGALRCSELVSLEFQNFTKVQNIGYWVEFDFKTKTTRDGDIHKFLIPDKMNDVSLTDIIDTYYNTLSKNLRAGRFFKTYRVRSQKFINSPVGRNTIAKFPLMGPTVFK